MSKIIQCSRCNSKYNQETTENCPICTNGFNYQDEMAWRSKDKFKKLKQLNKAKKK